MIRIKDKLICTLNEPLFRYKNRAQFTTKNVGLVAKKISNINNLSEKERYTGYSFRIGGSTLSSINKIPDPKLLRYVGWKPSHLPHVSNRYMRFKNKDLANFISELLHPTVSSTQNNSYSNIYDPWATKINTTATTWTNK